MTDGFRLSSRHWKTSDDAKRAILCIPGTGGNCEFFRPIGRDLSGEGNDVYGLDLRGFGDSVEAGLQRGDTRSFPRQLRDLDEVIHSLHQAHEKVFMFGHSHGCAYTLWYATNHPDALDGVILASPPVFATSKVRRSEYLKFALALIFTPKMMYSFGEEEIEELASNPLIARRVSIRWLYGSKKYLLDPLFRNASIIRKPVLIIQGDADTNTLSEGAQRLYATLKVEDKSIQIFPGADHFLYGALFPSFAYGDARKKRDVSDAVATWLINH